MHHTKVKADIGLCKVITDLTVKNHVVCIPLSEHQAFDLVVVCQNHKMLRIQVKYAALRKNGTVEVAYRRNWSDSKGTYSRYYNELEFDYYAIYCAGKDVVLYVPNKLNGPKAIRFERTRNNQDQNVHWAKDFLDF